jgi:hypothetical protein
MSLVVLSWARPSCYYLRDLLCPPATKWGCLHEALAVDDAHACKLLLTPAIDKDIARAASEFGLSRPTIYQARSQVEAEGLEGLLPRKRGPRAAHKLTAELLGYLGAQRAAEPQVSAGELAARIRRRFQLTLHPRTIEKALQRQSQKKGRLKQR